METILVVDDQRINIEIMMGLLGDKYDIIVALNAQAALEILQKEDIDLILLDIVMPGMNGFELCRAIKKDEKTKGIPVIFLTTRTDEQGIEDAYDIGGSDYISKPFKPKELLSRVNRELKLKSLIKDYESVINELQTALQEVKALKGLIPICSKCKNIRDDKGYWNQLEAYIEKHSDAQFSHSMCEICAVELYGDQEWYKKKKSHE